MSVMKKALVILAMIQLAACASKPKTEATPDDKAAVMDKNVTSEPMDAKLEGSDSGKFAGLTTVHFDYDRAIVSPAEAKVLAKNAEWIKAHPDMKIQIEGHCDHRGSVEYNMALGERRAKAVYNILVGAGIPKDRLSTLTFGDQRPVEQGDNEEAFAKNRRANFVPLNQPQTHLSSN